jgi:hypothetical protein
MSSRAETMTINLNLEMMMRKLLAFSVALIFSLSAFAQAPVVNSDGSITGPLQGKLSANGSVSILGPVGNAANPISNAANTVPNPVFSGTTAAIGGSSLAAGVCASSTVTIAGAATSMVAVADASTTAVPGAGFVVLAQVTSANTVTVSVCAIVIGTPTASTYLVRVIS